MTGDELRAQLTRRRAKAKGSERRLLDSFGELLDLADSYDQRAAQATRQAAKADGPGERIDLARVASESTDTAARLRVLASRGLTQAA